MKKDFNNTSSQKTQKGYVRLDFNVHRISSVMTIKKFAGILPSTYNQGVF